MKSFIGKESLKDAMTLMKGDLSKKEDIVSDFTDAQVAEMWGSTAALSYSVFPEYEIDNWNYTFDGESGVITLNSYKHAVSTIHIYGREIEDNLYKIKIINFKGLFNDANKSTLENIYFHENIDISAVKSFYEFFYAYSHLRNIVGLNKLNTSNIENMSEMFAVCELLETLDLSNFETKNVINMSGMFRQTGLTSLDLTSFDTHNVTDMSRMFINSKKLTEIKVSRDKWVISDTCDTTDMFANCKVDHVTYVD